MSLFYPKLSFSSRRSAEVVRSCFGAPNPLRGQLRGQLRGDHGPQTPDLIIFNPKFSDSASEDGPAELVSEAIGEWVDYGECQPLEAKECGEGEILQVSSLEFPSNLKLLNTHWLQTLHLDQTPDSIKLLI